MAGAFRHLLEFHREIRSRLADALRPPASEEQLERAQARLEFEFHSDVLALYGLADGMDVPQWWRQHGVRPSLIAYAQFPGLDDSVGTAEEMRAVAADVVEIGDMWRPSWFPVLELHADEVLVVDCADEAGEVWLVRWEADEIRPSAGDLATCFDHAVRRMREAGVTAGEGGFGLEIPQGWDISDFY